MSKRDLSITRPISIAIVLALSVACFVRDDDDDDDAGDDTSATTDGDGGSASMGVTIGNDDDGDDGGDDGDDDGGSDGDDDGETSDVPPYGACPSGSDVQCGGEYECIDEIDTCSSLCFADQDCPDPASGTSFQRCEDQACVLFCGDGSDCPDGMSCGELTNGLGETIAVCVWA